METSENELLQIVENLYKSEDFGGINDMLTDTLLTEYKNPTLYAYKSLSIKCGCEKCLPIKLTFAEMAITAEPSLSIGYLARGNAWARLKSYNNALKDFKINIEIGGESATVFYQIGHVLFHKKNYKKALQSLNKTIALDNKHIYAYVMRSLTFSNLNRPIKALTDANKVLEMNPKEVFQYINRANLFNDLRRHKQALDDFEHFLSTVTESDLKSSRYSDYAVLTANREVHRLRKILADAKYRGADDCVRQIKKVLQYNAPLLSHYTSLTNAKAMIFDKSLFRISEGTYLNDPSEGKQLSDYLGFNLAEAELGSAKLRFIEKPFVGSFVADNKANDLTLWRMYGKEESAEAKGCSLTVRREKFEEALHDKYHSINTGQFNFYYVAYWDKKKFTIPSGDGSAEKENLLNNELEKLKLIVEILSDSQKKDIAELFNGIAFLFKNSNFKDEHEVRLVIDGIGFQKKITISNSSAAPPKVYIELLNLTSVLDTVILGPKVEKAEEWAAAFNYHFKENKEDIEVFVSHVPFK